MIQRQPSLLETFAVFLVFLIYSNCFNFFSNLRFETPVWALLLKSLAPVVAAILTLNYWFRQPQAFRRILSQFKSLLWFVFICALSIFWSSQPLLTLKEVGLLCVSVSFAAYLVRNFSLPNLLLLICSCAVVGGISCLFWWSLDPTAAWSSSSIAADGHKLFGLRGSYGHKNILGFMMDLSILSLLFLYSLRRASGRLTLFLLAFFGFFLTCSRSATSYGGCLLVVILWSTSVWGASLPTRERKSLGRWLICFALTLFIVGALNWASITNLLNRGPTLTGRTLIWRDAWTALLKHPWLGYGFNSFWPKNQLWTGFSEAFAIWNKLHWPTPNAHNSYLDLVLGTGFLGFTLFVGFLISLFTRLIRKFFSDGSGRPTLINAGFGLSFGVMLVSFSFVESFLLDNRFALFVLFYIALSSNENPRENR